MSWRSALFVEETRVPWENHQPAANYWHNVVSSTPRLSGVRTHHRVEWRMIYHHTMYVFCLMWYDPTMYVFCLEVLLERVEWRMLLHHTMYVFCFVILHDRVEWRMLCHPTMYVFCLEALLHCIDGRMLYHPTILQCMCSVLKFYLTM
jgi:hypothetical protein